MHKVLVQGRYLFCLVLLTTSFDSFIHNVGVKLEQLNLWVCAALLQYNSHICIVLWGEKLL